MRIFYKVSNCSIILLLNFQQHTQIIYYSSHICYILKMLTMLSDQMYMTFHYKWWNHQWLKLRNTVYLMEKNVLVFYFCFSQHFVVLILQSVHYITIWICYFAELHVTSIPYASLTPLHVTKLKYEFKQMWTLQYQLFTKSWYKCIFKNFIFVSNIMI